MATKTINTSIILRNDTAANWNTNNPVLRKGELGVESDTRKFKFGDGTTNWVGLSYSGVDEDAITNLISENRSTVYEYTKASSTETDDQAIASAVGSNTPVKDDICIISTTIDTGITSKSAFVYNGTTWVAMDGNVDANKVILRDNITMAGNYTQVGNLSKTSNGTATFSTKGKSVAEALTEIFSKRLQPIKTNPAVTVTLTGAGSYEVGTAVSVSYKATLSAGSYTYGPTTGITATDWTVTSTAGDSSTTATGSFDAVTVTDDTNYNVTATANYGDGAVAKDNLGSDSSPVVQITAGSASKTSSSITGYRSFFYGVVSSSTAEAPLTSALIRGLTNGKKYDESKTFTLNSNSTAKRIVIAIPSASITSTRQGLKEVLLTSALNSDITGLYTHTATALQVEGSNGYEAVDYDVWVYEPSAMDAGEVHKITLY